MVCADGFDVAIETTTISTAERIVIGTTGMNPQIVVPPAVRARTSTPPSAQTTTGGPGAGAGIAAWKTPVRITLAIAQIVEASAPHLVLPFQNSAAIMSGNIAEYPENAYCVAKSKIVAGAFNAIA